MLRVNQLYGFGARRAAAGSSDPSWASVTLLMGFEGADTSTTFTDESLAANACTAVGNAQIDTAFFKFGTSGGLFDGSGDRVNVSVGNDTDFAFGTGDFSVECWLRPQRTDGYIMGCSENNTFAGWWFRYDATTLYFTSSVFGTTVSKAWTPVNGTWYFLQAVRTGTSLDLAVDGVSLGTGTMSNDITNGSSHGLALGSRGQYFGGDLFGTLDEVRITKGVARAIALPTAAFPRS